MGPYGRVGCESTSIRILALSSFQRTKRFLIWSSIREDTARNVTTYYYAPSCVRAAVTASYHHIYLTRYVLLSVYNEFQESLAPRDRRSTHIVSYYDSTSKFIQNIQHRG